MSLRRRDADDLFFKGSRVGAQRLGVYPRTLNLVACVAALLLLSIPARAFACSVCTNPTFRAAAPTGYPLRLTLDLKVGEATAGGVSLVDRRLDLIYTLDATPEVEISVDVPTLMRSAEGERETFAAVPGDVEMGATGAVWTRGERGRVVEKLQLRGTLKLPSAPVDAGPDGAPLSSVLQPGCSSIVPSLGVAYQLASPVWIFGTGASAYLPVPVREAPHTAASVRSFVTLGVRAGPYVSATLGWTTRWEPSGELSPDIGDPNSGGFVGSVLTGLSVSPHERLTLSAAVYVPVAQALAGDQRLGATYAASIEARF